MIYLIKSGSEKIVCYCKSGYPCKQTYIHCKYLKKFQTVLPSLFIFLQLCYYGKCKILILTRTNLTVLLHFVHLIENTATQRCTCE